MPEPATSSKSGFRGAIGNLPLVDLLQVWSVNRFSGLVKVDFQGRRGQLYFTNGELVHAEAEGQVGEGAVQVIVGWPQGAFEVFQNTSTIHRTIEKSVSHLLLDAHRVLDERQRNAAQPACATVAGNQPASQGRPKPLDEIRALPGVALVVSFGEDGRPRTNDGPEAEQLAARGLYLAVTHAAAVTRAFGLGELSLAVLRAEADPLVLVHHGGRYLCVAAPPGTPLEPLLGQLRSILRRPAVS
jgi:hypothetical protein